MFSSLGRFTIRRRWWVLAAAVLFLIVGGVWGAGAGGTLGGGGGLDDPNAESSQADHILQDSLGRYTADVVVVYESDELTVDDPEFQRLVEEAAARVPAESYEWQETYWSTGSDDFVADDGHKTYVSFQLAGNSEEERVEVYQDNDYPGLLDVPELDVRYGGLIAVNDQFNGMSAEDLRTVELVATPLLLIMLLFVFRSVIAALLPLSIAVFVAVGSLGVLRAVGGVVELSTIAINVVVVLGLGLATDYALLIVTRFREQLAKGQSVPDAVVHTMGTAGRTVVVSGLTIAATLGGLLVFPSRFLQSLAWSGVSVVVFAVIAAVTVLPALLYLAGHRVNSLRVPLPRLRRARAADADVRQDGWYRTAHMVMRRPLLWTIGLSMVLLAIGTPLLGASWARPAEWALPEGTDSKVVTEELTADFGHDPTKIVTAVVTMPEGAETPEAAEELDTFTERLVAVDGIHRGSVTGVQGDLARITLYYSMDPMGPDSRPMTEELRAVDTPEGSEVLFTNRPFGVADMLDMLGERLVWMGAIVALITFVVLFMAFGSVIMPLKTLALNVLSLSAAYGAMVLIFQYGLFSGLLGFEPTGYIDANMPLLVAALAFGLAMDYEVFVLARIRENYLRTGDAVESVAFGIQHTARIITAAALLLGIVVFAFVFMRISVLMMIGVGLVIAIAVDATLVRGLLLPATMKLLGRWAWWSPAPMARWWDKYGIPEESGDDDDVPGGEPGDRSRDPLVGQPSGL
ncbi:RND superfamily putative drug exporter [Nocardiopsis sp. Huas11]|uniref:MMPL family transporter n=1 Tax=Nocardiopsis sp. Huas11 TaxID=2183912 RepID=UPI000EABE1E4|nr:MMPL family transporter [Nocardiopsis sp. Huas11]RKS09666.1 RND superfamily putative drug exporter [Nocardiopsis sp. Huas11]